MRTSLNTIYYHKAKEKGLCPRCLKEHDEYTVLCAECTAKAKAIYMNQKQEVKDRNNRYRQRKKEICTALGICSTCFQEEATPGMVSCQHCRNRAKYRRLKNIKEKRMTG